MRTIGDKKSLLGEAGPEREANAIVPEITASFGQHGAWYKIFKNILQIYKCQSVDLFSHSHKGQNSVMRRIIFHRNQNVF